MTGFGIIWLSLLLWSFFLNHKWIVFLVLFSCIFQSTAVLNIGEKGFSPVLFSQIIFFIRFFPYILGKKIQINSIFKWMLLFFGFSLITLFFPYIFEGMLVYSPEYGIDSNYIKGGTPLSFRLGNIVQIIYLYLNLFVIYILYLIKTPKLQIFAFKSVIFSIIFVLVIGFWEFLFKRFNLFFFPKSFFYNNNGVINLSTTTFNGNFRMNSTFPEASFAGGFLAASFWGLYAVKWKWSNMLCIIIFLALCLNLSGTGIAAFCLGGVTIFVFFRDKKVIYFIFLIIIGGGIIYLLNYNLLIKEIVFNKTDSQSGIIREASNIFSWNIFLKTYGIGVGLGSHRASSLWFTMLANVGLIGSFLFFRYMFEILKMNYLEIKNNLIGREQIDISRFSFNYVLVLLIAQVLAIPDLSLSVYWMGLYLSTLYINNGKLKFYL